jgi:large subunit ribosomal protein L25
MSVSVECQTRAEGAKPRALRREGLIPAALYGHQGTESLSLIIPEKAAHSLLKKAAINNTLVDVSIPELSWQGKTLIKEVQSHPWKRTLYHISFFAVAAHGKLDITVPLRVVGESVGIKQGGLIEQSVIEIKVKCNPEDIPEFINVDITELNVGQAIAVGDLVLPEGVSLDDDPNKTILSIIASKK